ncbi:hypothetical protein BDP27DRAFT_1405723 [Rhodocollybia butyracea]|uniref:Uncharacterized protein n=1 Tax=Rhodocollybia butyracea TaxID=206335 RepID=A0A9P5PKG4_9AGAR|nr:hypothetical protein BDP27DRAFT_1405723 [Rhodocollybia butyracea]
MPALHHEQQVEQRHSQCQRHYLHLVPPPSQLLDLPFHAAHRSTMLFEISEVMPRTREEVRVRAAAAGGEGMNVPRPMQQDLQDLNAGLLGVTSASASAFRTTPHSLRSFTKPCGTPLSHREENIKKVECVLAAYFGRWIFNSGWR